MLTPPIPSAAPPDAALKRIREWAFVVPRLSAHTDAYLAGILNLLRGYPNVYLDLFTYDECDVALISRMHGLITYGLPPRDFLERIAARCGASLPVVSITLSEKAPPSIALARISARRAAELVVGKLSERHCRSYGFCSSHVTHLMDESAKLLLAYRRVVWERTGAMPRLFRPIATTDPNLILSEARRFSAWLAQMPKPCGMFVHGDDVAKKMLDTCRLFGICVPRDLRVISTDNAALFCERTIPSLSSIAIDHAKVGCAAAAALMDMLEKGLSPQAASFDVEPLAIVERGTSLDDCGCARCATEACSFIHAEIDRGFPVQVEDIVRHLNVSRRKLEVDFKATYGHTLHDEIDGCRLDRLAKALVSSDATIGELVAQCGYATRSQAQRSFAARFGMSMSAYRATS